MSLEVLGYDAAGYRFEEVLEFTMVSYLYTYFSNPIAEPKIKESPWTLFLTIRKMILSSRESKLPSCCTNNFESKLAVLKIEILHKPKYIYIIFHL